MIPEGVLYAEEGALIIMPPSFFEPKTTSGPGVRFVEDYEKWAREAEPLIADFKQSGCSSWVEYLGQLNKQGESK